MNDSNLVITIDGPSGAGKSVLGEQLAAALNYLYFDTGVLYRALTWLALQKGIDPSNQTAMVELAQCNPIDVRPPSEQDGRQYDVIADGQDITWRIRNEDVDRNVSVVSAHPKVRQLMLNQQRAVAGRGGVVMVGRDTGTVVCPDADIKVYVDAPLELRAQRRYEQRLMRGDAVDYATVLDDLERRDYIDSHRASAPLRPPEGAYFIDTGLTTVEEEVTQVLRLVKEYALQSQKQ